MTLSLTDSLSQWVSQTIDFSDDCNDYNNDYNDCNDYNDYNDYKDSDLDLDLDWERSSDEKPISSIYEKYF